MHRPVDQRFCPARTAPRFPGPVRVDLQQRQVIRLSRIQVPGLGALQARRLEGHEGGGRQDGLSTMQNMLLVTNSPKPYQ